MASEDFCHMGLVARWLELPPASTLLLDSTALRQLVRLWSCGFWRTVTGFRQSWNAFVSQQGRRWETLRGPSPSALWCRSPCASWRTLVCRLPSPWWCLTTCWTRRAPCPWPLNMWAGVLPNMWWLWVHCVPCRPGNPRVICLDWIS